MSLASKIFSWKLLAWLALIGVSIFLFVFMIMPVAVVLVAGLTWDFLKEIWLHPVYREVFYSAFEIAFTTTFFCFLLALPTAWFATRYRFRGKALLEGML